MLQVLRVLHLEEKELALLDITLIWSRDEFLIAKVLADMCGAPPVDTGTYEALYLEFKEAIQLLREGKL